ncbi:MAG: DNA-3-methyladenine glycosylase family protein [Methylophilaceae bacterium]
MNTQAAAEYLSHLDADWAGLVRAVGPCSFELERGHEPYEALVKAVAYQQLHARAAEAILSRMLSLYAGQFPAPEQLISTEFDQLRACGFSASKIATIQGIAQGKLDGLVPTRIEADNMTDEDLITRLVTLKGIGRWTVEMLLIFTLGRMDVLPVDDFAVKDGYKRLKSLEKAPTPKQLAIIGQAWSPYRTISAWYLWRVPR